ncbi:MAG: SpaH/EbpB family LPXTG-anchored major pilin [Clostridia bacterium]|nr:SpaH/EbpB family LPXTG-anchored major pilin [Clostridia bacterium]
MRFFSPYKRIISVILSVAFMISVAVTAFSADADITESNTYVLNRDGNGEPLYLYQSPCMIGYDFNNQYGGNGVPIQAFVYTMYNSVTGERFPTYCGDINVTAVQGADYRRMNLEDSSFSANSAGMVRAILQEGFYIIPVDGESDDAHAQRVSEKTAALAAASGAEGLTTGEAIAATQAAIWQVVHGQELSFPKFCRYVFNPTNTKYGSLCSYSELRYKNNALINSTIATAYNYLLSLAPVAPTEKSVSPTSFTDLNDPVFSENTDGTYDIAVTVTVDVDLSEGDTLTLKADIDDTYIATHSLSDGEQTVTLTLRNVPSNLISEDVMLSISGYQTARGYFLFDAEGARGSSQTMVGYNDSQLPVYAQVRAAEDRILNIYKSASFAVGNDSYESRPLSNISFDIFPVATMEEYRTGAVTLPDATEYVCPSLADYTLTTDENGEASMNFLHHALPDGVYLVTEHRHPSIVAPIDPFYLFVPSEDPDTGETVYEITIKPKNDVRGGVHIEKDVISVGNDEASVNAYDPHTWIISTTVPDDIAGGKSYVISDTLDNRLDYVGNVSVVLENGIDEPFVTLESGVDYTLTVSDVDSLSDGKPSDSFSVALTPSGMTKVSDIIGDNVFNSYILRVYFDALINANAEIATEIPNRAEIEYTNSVNFEFSQKSDIPVVYTGGANLLKVDSRDNTRTLSGAVFEVYRAATQEEVGAGGDDLIVLDKVPGLVVKVSFFDNPLLTGEKVDFAVSGDDGRVCVYGLAYGNYYMIETKAPDGYNASDEPFEITVNESSHNEENIILVENRTGSLLPETGGIGTTVFTAGGITLMCLPAVYILILKRRKIEE